MEMSRAPNPDPPRRGWLSQSDPLRGGGTSSSAFSGGVREQRSMDAKGFAAQRSRPDVVPITGIGDDAVQSTRIPVLTVKKGNVYFALSVAGLPPDQAKAAEQALAKQVVTGP